jgi:prepilin-type N-terminal cleavage/methylation domain-containing protein
MSEPPARAAGFSLVEVLVALALAGTILLFASGCFWLQLRTAERLDAGRRADAALENLYEELRAGLAPLVTGPAGTTADGIALELLVAPSATAPLADVALLARYRLRGEWHERRLEARLYTP